MSERESRASVVLLAGTDHCSRERGLVGCIGKLLRLEAETGPADVRALTTAQCAIEEVAGVELQARLGGEHVETAAGGSVALAEVSVSVQIRKVSSAAVSWNPTPSESCPSTESQLSSSRR